MAGDQLPDDLLWPEEPDPWQAPVACPTCGQTQTRFVGRHYEMSVYECELCQLQFEVDD